MKMDPGYIIEKYEPIFNNVTQMRQELEDKFDAGLEETTKELYEGMSPQEVAQEEPEKLAYAVVGAIVTTALKNEGEEGLAAEYLEALKMRINGEEGGSEAYLDTVSKIKDTQILQTKYGVETVYDLERQMEALSGAGKMNAKVAKQQVEQYAGQRVITEAQQALSLISELGPDAVGEIGEYLGSKAQELGVAYTEPKDWREAVQKGVTALTTKQQIEQSLEGRLI